MMARFLPVTKHLAPSIFYFYFLLFIQLQRKYSPDDGLHGPKHVVSEWNEIIKNFVATDGHYNKVLKYLPPYWKSNSDWLGFLTLQLTGNTY
jgi:hypothetical protein